VRLKTRGKDLTILRYCNMTNYIVDTSPETNMADVCEREKIEKSESICKEYRAL